MTKLLTALFLLVISAVWAAAQNNNSLVGANGKRVEIDEGWTYLAHEEYSKYKGKVWELYLYQPSVFHMTSEGSLMIWVRRKPYVDYETKIAFVLDSMEVRCKSREWKKVMEFAIYTDGSNERTISPSDNPVFTRPTNPLGNKIFDTICKLDVVQDSFRVGTF